jgi:hypothetical protein
MGWEALILDVMLEFLNKFLVKGAHIYFGHKDKVYVINNDALLSSLLDPLEGLGMLNCGKLELGEPLPTSSTKEG